MKIVCKPGLLFIVWTLFFTFSVNAIPLEINYQGEVNVGGVPFDGMGAFKFAIVDGTGSVQYWSNDGAEPPVNVVLLEVNNGLFNVVLGDTEMMDAIPAAVFDHDEIFLRVWFDDVQGTGSQRLIPDQKITSAGFAVKSQSAVDADTVDGVHASSLEESAEIDSDIAAHTSESSAHHTKTASFSELVDQASDAQIPDDITLSLSSIQAAASNDFHNIGGTDLIDDADADPANEIQTLSEVLSENNDADGNSAVNFGAVGIGVMNPAEELEVNGTILSSGEIKTESNFIGTGIPEYADNAAAIAGGLTSGSFYHTAGVLKIVYYGELYSVDNIIGNMRHIGGGTFIQGSPSSESCRLPNEQQFIHTLTRDIAVMEIEITRQMWAYLASVQTSLPDDPTDGQYGSGMSNPVQHVTWYEAVLFATLLSIENGLTPCYYRDSGFTDVVDAGDYQNDDHYCNFDSDGYRLPTEGEREFFARAGTTGPFSCSEPSYNSETCESCSGGTLPTLEQYCVFCANAVGESVPVGSKLSNPWNLKDVHGNVLEWCWDWFGAYPAGPETDYTCTISSAHRVIRGGSWPFEAKNQRSAIRSKGQPVARFYANGFRLVRTVP